MASYVVHNWIYRNQDALIVSSEFTDRFDFRQYLCYMYHVCDIC